MDLRLFYFHVTMMTLPNLYDDFFAFKDTWQGLEYPSE